MKVNMEEVTLKRGQDCSVSATKNLRLSGPKCHSKHAVDDGTRSTFIAEIGEGNTAYVDQKQSWKGRGVLDQLVLSKMHDQLGRTTGEEGLHVSQELSDVFCDNESNRHITTSEGEIASSKLQRVMINDVWKRNKRKRMKISHVPPGDRVSTKTDTDMLCGNEVSDVGVEILHDSPCNVNDTVHCINRLDRATDDEGSGCLEENIKDTEKARRVSEESDEGNIVGDTCRFQALNARPKVLKTSGNLFGMMRKIEDRRKHTCEECGRSFNQLRVLTVHQQMHTIRQNQQYRGENSPDEICEYKSVNKLEHEDPSNLKEMHFCAEDRKVNIDQESCTTDEVPEEATQSGNSASEVNCTKTAKKKQIKGSKIPENPCVNQKGYPCNVCGKIFNLPSFLRRHQLVHTGEKAFACKFCGKCFGQKATCQRHELTHGKNEPYMCNECGDGFSSTNRLEKHVKEKHSASKDGPLLPAVKIVLKLPKVNLPDSDDRETQSTSVRVDTSTGEEPENGLDATPVVAEGTGERKTQLKEVKMFVCPICEKTFFQRSHLNRHSLCHTGEKPFKCKECGKGFTQKSTCLRHERSHTGELPFICTECGNGFAQKSGLQKHRLIHTGERPYQCRFCECTFTQKTTCQRHERIHTGEKPYVCQQCGRAFGQRTSLERHVKTHMKAKPLGESGNSKTLVKNM